MIMIMRIIKAIIERPNKIPNFDYVVTEMKRSIT